MSRVRNWKSVAVVVAVLTSAMVDNREIQANGMMKPAGGGAARSAPSGNHNHAPRPPVSRSVAPPARRTPPVYRTPPTTVVRVPPVRVAPPTVVRIPGPTVTVPASPSFGGTGSELPRTWSVGYNPQTKRYAAAFDNVVNSGGGTLMNSGYTMILRGGLTGPEAYAYLKSIGAPGW